LIGKRYKEEKKAVGENQYTAPASAEEIGRAPLSQDQRTYLIGKRTAEEKKQAAPEDSNSLNRVPHCEAPSRISQKIAEQAHVSHATVERAEKFADAVDKVAENTGINPQEILSYIL